MGQAAPLTEAEAGFPSHHPPPDTHTLQRNRSASGATAVATDAGTQPPSHAQ